MLGFVLDYWKVIVPTKSVAELEAEDFLFVLAVDENTFWSSRHFRFSRWWLLFFCCLSSFCVGSLHAFTIVIDCLDVYFYGSQTRQTVSVKLQSMFWMGICAALSGPYIERKGPRRGVLIGTALVSLGFIVSQLAVGALSPTFLMVGYGFFCGAGFGFIIIATMSPVQKWFPDMRGLVSGLNVFSSGAGNTAISLLYTVTLNRGGLYEPVKDVSNIPHIFWTTGLCIVTVFIFTALVIRTPPPNYIVNGHDIHCVPQNRQVDPAIVQDEYLKVGMTLINYSIIRSEEEGSDGDYFMHVKALSLVQCIFSSDFIFLYISFAACIIPATVLATEVYDIFFGIFEQSIDATNQAVMQGMISNSLGRLLVPLLSDAIIRVFYANPAFARKSVMVFVLSAQVVLLLVLPTNPILVDPLRIVALGLVFGSGGVLALIQCFVTDMFGVYHAGTMYGIILTSWSLRAVVTGYAFDSFHVTIDSLRNQLLWMHAMLIAGWAVMVFVRTTSLDRFYQGYQYSLGNRVLVQIPFRRPASNTCQIEDSTIMLASLHQISPTENDHVSSYHRSETLLP